MYKVLNIRMLANPFNWAIIYLVVVFFGLAMRTVVKQSAIITNAA